MKREPGGKAVYRLIAEEIAAEIGQGKLAPGDQVPSETVLIERFDVARGTARQAVRLLGEWGLVETIHGKGTFVTRTET